MAKASPTRQELLKQKLLIEKQLRELDEPGNYYYSSTKGLVAVQDMHPQHMINALRLFSEKQHFSTSGRVGAPVADAITLAYHAGKRNMSLAEIWP